MSEPRAHTTTRGRSWRLLPVWLGALVLLAATAGCRVAERDANPTPPAATPEPQDLPAPAFARAGSSVIADVAERSVASVVNVSSLKVVRLPSGQPFGPFFDDPFFRHFFGEEFFFPEIPPERRERSLGSGVIVRDDGIVLTNNHVVERAEEVRATLADGREFEVETIGTDPQTDIAVLRLRGDVADLRPLPFGDSDRLRLGDVVLAIGNPFGVGQTVTMGIVSAKGRANVGIVDYEDFIQTDAAINPGNSGGALVDSEGRLVGINTAIVSRTGGYQGIGFAIPSNMARTVMESLLEKGRVVRGWLGVVIQDLTPDLAAALGLEGVQGLLVAEVEKDGPAERAGLARGDVIVRFDGQPVESPGRLRNRVATAGAGVKLKLDVLRDGEERTLSVELGELPTQVAEPALREKPDATLGGLTLAPLDDALRQRLRIPDYVEGGVVVTRVTPGLPASRAGLRPGDLIREVDREPVRSVADFRRRYAEGGDAMLLLVQRGAGAIFLPLKKGR